MKTEINENVAEGTHSEHRRDIRVDGEGHTSPARSDNTETHRTKTNKAN